ncbi:unnamed protein product [Hyaloperonospora brassicae]|uniref:Uncharacterized protein n=1 Tax=Hyaloperonospora brassicae TaxID=162125 RepID=A0AAV0TM64_HYABA|nr:unnamed protein product [Hyaloperonospora brassicae]
MMTSPRQATAASARSEPPRCLCLPADGPRTSAVASPTAVKTPQSDSLDMRSQTCVEFLHIMKEFSESSCDANETVQRVDSLVNQDEQLLRLFPLSRLSGDGNGHEAAQRQLERRGRRVLEKSVEAAADGITGRPDLKDTDVEMDGTHDELQRWMDLDLDEFDYHVDVFDFQHPHPQAAPNDECVTASAPTTMLSTASMAWTKQQNGHNGGNGGNSGSSSCSRTSSSSIRCSTDGRNEGWLQKPLLDAATSATIDFGTQDTVHAPQKPLQAAMNYVPRCETPVYAAAAATAATATVAHGDDECAPNLVPDNATLSSGPAWKRAKVSLLAGLQGPRRAVLPHANSKGGPHDERRADQDEDGNVWGMESDGYEHDLLSSIDHAVLCDRENRFLQWDLEVAQRQRQQERRRLQVNDRVPHASAPAYCTGRTAGDVTTSSKSNSKDAVAIQTQRSLCQPRPKVIASSPMSSKSPSNVDIVEDWNSLDFGTFQNRTVSHILSSCLHKRKLYHPYKNQVQLVNFNVPSGRGSTYVHGTGPHAHQLGGSLATSLAFGGQQHGGDGLDGSSISGFVPLLATRHENGLGSGKFSGKGEKKTPKKREERKRLMTLKMQETFADLEGTFTEQDLDVKGIVGPGASLSKMALSKLENLPLPDLTNLPQDLRELKRKIEATEHKVEGTKHRHRKGGPCPRCQVQNQLRAAKRAYHKRAVAHKKLPHAVVSAVNDEAQEAANAQAAAAATLELAGSVTAAIKVAAGVDARKGSNASSLAAVDPGFAAKARPALTGVASLSTGLLKPKQVPMPSCVSLSPPDSSRAMSLVANTGTVGSVVRTAGSGSGSSSSLSCNGAPPLSSSSSAASMHSRARGLCGKAPPSAMPFPSPSSASVSPTLASKPSSSESASPLLQHVTVSSG